jgi:L-ascorbate metabolism protein UlaG (beta-lactamase superfamily)
MKTYSFILLLMISSMAIAQRSAPDQIETKKGPLLIQPILHGTVMFTWDGQTIYVDPYGGAKAFEGISAPDLILITDIHGDHMSVETLEGIETSNAIIIAPSAVTEKLPDNLKAQTTSLDNGKKIEKLGISITALPMYNLPEDSESRHTKGRGNGYVLNIGGKNIYLSGDTEDIPEMRALKNIDVAFVCMNLPYTMDIDQASSAVLDFKPKTVYPYHYRGQGGLADVEAFQKKVQGANNKIEVRLRNWYPSYK